MSGIDTDSTDEVILVGLDGLGFSEIDEWLEDGTLPVLGRLSETTAIDLESTHPPWTPCAWPSLLSGRNPGKHGVFDFFTRESYDKRLIERPDVDAPYLFETADAEGFTPIVVNYPVTNPAPALVNGAIVPGYLAPEDVEFNPEHIRAEYEDEYGEYVIYPEYGTDDVVNEYVNVARSRRDMARFLDGQYDWDLLAVQFQVTDSIFHDLEDRSKIRQVLERVDEFVGDIIDLGEEDASVFAVSDHGMGDYDWTFYVNSWLSEQGYCQTTNGDVQYFREKKKGLKGGSDGGAKAGLVKTIIERAATTLAKAGLSPRNVHRWLSRAGLAGPVERLLPAEAVVAAQNQVVDHANSAAFQLYFNSLGVHINVEGRDLDGVVAEEDYDEIRSELIADLEGVRDPDGNVVFDAVLPREEVYSGPHLTDAPDVVLVPRDYRYDVSGSILDTFRRNPHKNHKPDGILLTNRPPGEIDRGSIYDIAPTVAAELGIPVDTDTDGTVLTDVDERCQRKDWDELADEYVDSRDDTDTTSVEDRLADLGYME